MPFGDEVAARKKTFDEPPVVKRYDGAEGSTVHTSDWLYVAPGVPLQVCVSGNVKAPFGGESGVFMVPASSATKRRSKGTHSGTLPIWIARLRISWLPWSEAPVTEKCSWPASQETG